MEALSERLAVLYSPSTEASVRKACEAELTSFKTSEGSWKVSLGEHYPLC